MSIFNYALDRSSYFEKAHWYGFFYEHGKRAADSAFAWDRRVIHGILAVVEFVPFVGQIASLFERLIVCSFPLSSMSIKNLKNLHTKELTADQYSWMFTPGSTHEVKVNLVQRLHGNHGVLPILDRLAKEGLLDAITDEQIDSLTLTQDGLDNTTLRSLFSVESDEKIRRTKKWLSRCQYESNYEFRSTLEFLLFEEKDKARKFFACLSPEVVKKRWDHFPMWYWELVSEEQFKALNLGPAELRKILEKLPRSLLSLIPDQHWFAGEPKSFLSPPLIQDLKKDDLLWLFPRLFDIENFEQAKSRFAKLTGLQIWDILPILQPRSMKLVSKEMLQRLLWSTPSQVFLSAEQLQGLFMAENREEAEDRFACLPATSAVSVLCKLSSENSAEHVLPLWLSLPSENHLNALWHNQPIRLWGNENIYRENDLFMKKLLFYNEKARISLFSFLSSPESIPRDRIFAQLLDIVTDQQWFQLIFTQWIDNWYFRYRLISCLRCNFFELGERLRERIFPYLHLSADEFERVPDSSLQDWNLSHLTSSNFLNDREGRLPIEERAAVLRRLTAAQVPQILKLLTAQGDLTALFRARPEAEHAEILAHLSAHSTLLTSAEPLIKAPESQVKQSSGLENLPVELIEHCLSFFLDPSGHGMNSFSNRQLASCSRISKTIQMAVSNVFVIIHRPNIHRLISKSLTVDLQKGMVTASHFASFITKTASFRSRQFCYANKRAIEKTWALEGSDQILEHFDIEIGNEQRQREYSFVLDYILFEQDCFQNPNSALINIVIRSFLTKAVDQDKIKTVLSFAPIKLIFVFLTMEIKLGRTQWLDWVRDHIPEALEAENDSGNLAHFASIWNQPAILDWIKTNRPHLLDRNNSREDSFATLGALNNHLEILNWTMRHHPKILEEQRSPLASVAAAHGLVSVFQWILENKPSLLELTPPYLNIAYGAAMFGHVNVLNWIKDNCPRFLTLPAPHPPYDDHKTLLNLAAESGKIEILNWIHQHLPELLTSEEELPSSIGAAGFGQIAALEWMRMHAPDLLSRKNIPGNVISQVAAITGQVDILTWIQTHRPHLLSAQNLDGDTMAHRAAFHGQVRTLQWMKIHFPEIFSVKNNQGKTFLDLAIEKNRVGVLKEFGHIPLRS